MSFRWTEYRVLALELTGVAGFAASEEARQRTAISRAYYAAFCTARDYLERTRAQRFESGDVHRKVKDAFLNMTGDKGLVSVGNRLSQMHIKRKKADYDVEFRGLADDVTSVLRQAERVIAELENRTHN